MYISQKDYDVYLACEQCGEACYQQKYGKVGYATFEDNRLLLCPQCIDHRRYTEHLKYLIKYRCQWCLKEFYHYRSSKRSKYFCTVSCKGKYSRKKPTS